jgi:threonine/homoserine/homoserine lactone efflux protein
MGEIFRHVLAVLPAFLLACLAVAALPGPSTALFLHRTVRDGRAAGLAAVAGNEIGVFCWALAAGAGLTGLLRANRWLYLALHIVGAVVLVYLGVSASWARPWSRSALTWPPRPAEPPGAGSAGRRISRTSWNPGSSASALGRSS